MLKNTSLFNQVYGEKNLQLKKKNSILLFPEHLSVAFGGLRRWKKQEINTQLDITGGTSWDVEVLKKMKKKPKMHR